MPDYNGRQDNLGDSIEQAASGTYNAAKSAYNVASKIASGTAKSATSAAGGTSAGIGTGGAVATNAANATASAATSASASAAGTAAGSAAGTAAGAGGGAATGAAVGSAGGPIGAAVGLAIGLFGDKIVKGVIVVCSFFVVILLVLLAALPTVVSNKAFGLDGKKPKDLADNDNTKATLLIEQHDQIDDDIDNIIDAGHKEALKKIRDDLKDKGLDISLADVTAIAGSSEKTRSFDDQNCYVIISDATASLGYSYDTTFIMAAYSASLVNSPHVLGKDEDENLIDEELYDFKGTHRKDLKKKLKKQRENMFPVSTPPQTTTETRIERVQYYETVTEEITTTETSYIPTEYTVYEDQGEYDIIVEEPGIFGTVKKSFAKKHLYLPAKEKGITSEPIQQHVYKLVSVKLARHNAFGQLVFDDPYPAVAYERTDEITTIFPATETTTTTEYVEKQVLKEKEVETTWTVYKYTIGLFDDDCVYNAFQIDKFADYANSGETNYDVINNIEDNILRTMNREKTLSQNGKITGSIAQNAKVFSVNNIEWYVVPLGTESLSEAEDAPNYSQRVDKFLTPSAHMLTPEDIELNFDLSEYPWRGSIKSATVNGIGCITVYRTLLTEDGEFGTTGEKWFSSEFYTKYSSNFVSPFAKYEYARITSHFGYRGAVNGIETLKIHGGVDMSAYLNEASPTLGKDVCATGSGVVAESGWSGYGNYVIIDHGNGISSLYGHLNDRSVTAGETVAQGQVIGHAGTTYGSGGYSSGPHLHFEIRVDGVKKDPEEYVDFSMHK